MKVKQTKAKNYKATKLDPKRRKALKRREKLAKRDVKFAKKQIKLINKLMAKALAEFKTMQEEQRQAFEKRYEKSGAPETSMLAQHTHDGNCHHEQELTSEQLVRQQQGVERIMKESEQLISKK